MKKETIKIVILNIILTASMILAYHYIQNSQVIKASGTLQSQGKLVYNNGSDEIILDTADHQVLQDNIDFNAAKIVDIENKIENAQNTDNSWKVINLTSPIYTNTIGQWVYYTNPVLKDAKEIYIKVSQADSFHFVNVGQQITARDYYGDSQYGVYLETAYEPHNSRVGIIYYWKGSLADIQSQFAIRNIYYR